MMRKLIIITICILLFSDTRVKAASNAAGYETLREAECLPVELLVELPILQKDYFDLSSTHAYVRRCLGVNNKKKACITKDQTEKMEDWRVVKVEGSGKDEFIHVSWVSHEECRYQKRTCPIEDAENCHEKSITHYYNEVKCSCDCIVQIEGLDTCNVLISKASGTIIWLPILTFLLGVIASSIFVYFKIRHNKELTQNNAYEPPIDRKPSAIGFSDVEQPAEPPAYEPPIDRKPSAIGFSDVEQPAEPPALTADGDETDKHKIGFN